MPVRLSDVVYMVQSDRVNKRNGVVLLHRDWLAPYPPLAQSDGGGPRPGPKPLLNLQKPPRVQLSSSNDRVNFPNTRGTLS